MCDASRSGEREHTRSSAVTGGTVAARDSVLVQEAASPAEEIRELVRIDDKIKNERYRGQHEHQVSHGAFPALTC